MTDGDALVAAICAHSEEDTPRLVYADWLDENGDPDRAAFIRLMCRLARLSDYDPDRPAIVEEAGHMLHTHSRRWAAVLGPGVRCRLHLAKFVADFHRGFVEEIGMTAAGFLRRAGVLFRRTPLRRVSLRKLGDRAEALARFPHLTRLTTLWLERDCINDRAAVTVARSPHLTGLTHLGLSHNSIGPVGAIDVFKALAARPGVEVNLNSNEVGPTGAAALARSPALVARAALLLASNRIGDAGAAALLASPHIGAVRQLNLSWNEIGEEGAAARRSVVQIAGGPPDSPAVERELLVGWTRDLLKAVVEVAQGGEADGDKKSAPVHVVFFDRGEQRVLLEALARNFPPILDHTPPLYDFLTQLAAFDSPIASHLNEEVREQKNYPMTCQSLQSVATYLKFDWNVPEKFREVFRARLFDYLGKLDVDGQSEWYTRRSRFSSSIPLEYAYAAWGVLPPPRPSAGDEFADYRGATRDQLLAFQARRLEAVEYIAGKLNGNPNTTKTPFVLPDIARFDDKARSLAQALDEFVTIERLVALADWKATRHAPPERRVLMGECLLGRYVEADQALGVADQNRENERRRRLREEYVAEFKTKNPGKAVRLPRDQSAACKWSPEGLRVRLRLETAGVGCDLHEVLGLTDLREGTRVVLYPRWAVDERLPQADRTPFVPTPKQMLYGNRADIVRVEVERDAGGRATAGYVELELVESFGGEWSRGFVFPAINRTLEEGGLYTLDECPNDWYGYFCSQVVEGLGGGQPNTLYRRLVAFPPAGDVAGRPGQERFLAGLDAFHAAGQLHGFEPGKRDYIGGHGTTPVLLVQGPPGTGKSYSTAFAVFARLQAAMQESRPLRAFASCKTHAATDVLVENVRDVRALLAKLREADPSLFDRFFDARLLEVPIYRVAPNNPPPDGVIPLVKDNDKGKDEDYNADLILEREWAVVGTTPGGVYGMLKAKWPKNLFGHDLCDLLVLDEASQMNLPEACMAALALKPDAPLVVVGDHRQMPPIVKHDWEAEARRTFRESAAYASLFETLLGHRPPVIRFEESFRLHGAMAEFLRQEVYRHDGIPYHSRRRDVLPAHPIDDPFVAAVLRPDYPLVVVTHGETDSQLRNPFEQSLVEPIVRTLADPARYGLDAENGVGVVVPHRAQRAALQQAFPELCVMDATTGLPGRSAIDTVERFQGGERTVVLVSATESDPAYLLAAGEFLLDPRRLTVAVSRAKRKMILVAARSVFALFSPDEEVFANSLLWKNLLLRTCTTLLWEGDRGGVPVAVWGGRLDGST